MGGSLRRRLLIGGVLIAVSLLTAGAVFVLSTWGDVNRVSIDRPEDLAAGTGAEEQSEQVENALSNDRDEDLNTQPPASEADVFLLVGSDSRADLEDMRGFGDFPGERADVVMVLIRPLESPTAALLSLPRDLLVTNPCYSVAMRINRALEGCGAEINGPTALTITVEELTGVSVDHFALIDLAGFISAVDTIGGYEICVEHAVRDSRARLKLPEGCTQASGAQTLAWLRSRSTQELTSDGWRVMAGVTDLTRNERQREFLVSMMSHLSDFSSPQAVASVAQEVAPFVTVDTNLSLLDAVDLAWTMRGLDSGSVTMLEVPVEHATTEEGAAVLVATADVAQIVADYLSPTTAEAASVQSG